MSVQQVSLWLCVTYRAFHCVCARNRKCSPCKSGRFAVQFLSFCTTTTVRLLSTTYCFSLQNLSFCIIQRVFLFERAQQYTLTTHEKAIYDAPIRSRTNIRVELFKSRKIRYLCATKVAIFEFWVLNFELVHWEGRHPVCPMSSLTSNQRHLVRQDAYPPSVSPVQVT